MSPCKSGVAVYRRPGGTVLPQGAGGSRKLPSFT